MAVLKNLSLSELLNICNNDFYDIIKNKDEFFEYLKTISHRVCDAYKIQQYPNYKTDNSMRKSCTGLFLIKPPQTIALNGNLIEAFDHFKTSKNLYYPFLLIRSIIHETRHYLQHNSDIDMDPIVKKYATYRMCSPIDIYKYISYGTEAIEIDARYFAFQVLRGRGLFDQFIYSTNSVYEETTRSKEISSIVRCLDETLKLYNNLLPETRTVLMDMNSAYNYFLYEIGLDREAFKRRNIYDLSSEEGKILKEKLRSQRDAISDFLYDCSYAIKDSERSQTGPLKEILKLSFSELRKFTSLSDAQKEVVASMIHLRAISKYETDKLYDKIAPEFSKLIQQGDTTSSPNDIAEFGDKWFN